MADQRIDQLNAETTPAAADVLPIYSIAGADTKKITVKNLVQQGAALVDDASIPAAKVNFSGISGTTLTDGSVTVAKLNTAGIPATGGVTVSSGNLQLVAPTSPIVRNAGTGSLEHANSGVTPGTYTKLTVDAKGHITAGATLTGADVPTVSTLSATGVAAGTYTKVTVNTEGRVTAATTLVDADVPSPTTTAGTYTKVVVDAKGRVTSGTTLVDADVPSPTTTAGTYTKVVVDAKGRVTSGTTLTDADVPALANTGVTAGTYTKLTVDAKGRVTVGANLAEADVPLANTGVTAGTYTKLTVDAKGRVTSGTTLTDADVPALADSGIAAGTYTKLTVDVKGRATAGTTLVPADLPIAVAGTVGVMSPGTGLSVTGGGVVNHTNSVTAGTTSGITFDAQGHITTATALVGGDLPVATSGVIGGVRPGTGLTVDGSGIINVSAATNAALGGVIVGSDFGVTTGTISLATQGGLTPGTYTKATFNSKGIATGGSTLVAGDIPNLAASQITSGSLDIARIAANTVTGAKLANYAITKIGNTQPTADQIGQFFFNPLSRDLFLWDGNVFQPIGISVGEIVFAGTFDASAGGGTGHVASVTAEGTAIGLVEGSPLPAAATANNRYYLVVSEGGTITSGNAPNVALAPPDIVLSTGIEWTEVDVSQTFTSVSAAQVSFTPEGTIAANNVQAAIEEVNNEKLGLAGGTMTGELLIGSAGTFAFEGATANAFETYLSAADPTADRAIVFPDQNGNVIVSGNASIVNADINASAAIVDTKLATIATAGKVSNSATTAASANTASAIVARDASGNFTAGTITAALTGTASSNVLKAGDTMTGALVVPLGTAGTPSLTFTGDLNTGIYSPGADQLAIATNGAVQLVVNSSGQVTLNSLGTAAAPAYSWIGDPNTGFFRPNADEIAIATNGIQRLTTSNSAISSTLPIDVPLGAAATPSITFSGDLNTGIYSPGADEIAIATSGTQRLTINSSGNIITTGSFVDPAIIGTILEDIFTITDAAAFEVDPGNGSIQLITLGASRTPKCTNFVAGESVTLMINDGTAYTITWTDATWGTGGVIWKGGTAPTLATTGYSVIQFWKVGSQVYGASVGNVA